MDKSKKTTIEELMGKPERVSDREPLESGKTEKFELPSKKSNAGLVGIFILLFLLAAVAYGFYYLYSETQTKPAETNDQKIINSTELEEKKRQELEGVSGPGSITSDNSQKIYYATADLGLNIRASASTDSDVMGSIPYGEKITPTSDDGVWTGVSYGDVVGFVSKEFLSETEPPALNNQ